jgi:hypothetical protein
MTRAPLRLIAAAAAAAALACACDPSDVARGVRGDARARPERARAYAFVAASCEDPPSSYRAHPVRVRGPRVLTAALTELLRLVRRAGDPPAAALLRGVGIEDGTATVDLAPLARTSLAWAATSCGGNAFWGMLNRTVFQFRSVRAVRYEMGGSCAAFHEFLQSACRGPHRLLRRAEWDPPPAP